MAAIFVSKYGMKHFKRSKIHAMNTLETHLRHFEQAFWYLPKIGKVAFYKTSDVLIMKMQNRHNSL